MLFSIIIATCGRPERLAVNLQAVGKAIQVSGLAHHVIVVDNAPDFDARKTVAECAAQASFPVRYLQSSPRNKSAALNVGIAAADTEWLAFTDDDTLPDPDWLVQGALFAQRGDCRVFGGRVQPAAPDVPPPAWLTPGRSGRIPLLGGAFVRYTPMTSSGLLGPSDPIPFGANVFVRRDMFRDHGGYDERLWVLCGKAALGVDDGEFGVRLKNAGEPIGYCHEALVVHPVHAERYSIWSHIKIGYYYGWRDPLVFFDAKRPVFELFRIRQLLGLGGRTVGDLIRREPAAAVSDVVDMARFVGCIAGRWSASYRKWAAMKGNAKEVISSVTQASCL
jgi:GT2 family glycosyltransferase